MDIQKHMDKQINFKQLLIALIIAMSPTFFVMWSNSRSDLKEKITSNQMMIENHSIKIERLENTNEKVLDKLDEINSNIVDLMLGLKDKQDRP